MKTKVATGIVLTVLLTGMLMLTLDIQQVEGSEPPATEWTRTYGGAYYDCAHLVVQTDDGGYALAGYTDSFGAGDNDFWLVKVDSSGDHQWNRTYGETGYDEAHFVVETSDGGYALAGRTYSFETDDDDFWLVKVDSSGDHQWNRTYGGAIDEMAYSVVETSDGGYALAGYTDSFGAGYTDFWLVKVDSSGDHQWNRTYGGAAGDRACSVVETSDGGYALAGTTGSFGAGFDDFWLVKVDSSGDHQWNRTYGETGEDMANSVVETSDGGYALAGGGFANLVKTDATGNLLWSRTYKKTGYGEAFSVVETSDGGFALAGYNVSVVEPHNIDSWLVKADSSGDHQWNRTYGETGEDMDDMVFSVVETSDGGYALAGYTCSFGAGFDDFWLVKVAGQTPVGGVLVPVDKFALLAPYVGLASTIVVATVATTIYVKRVKRRKEKQ